MTTRIINLDATLSAYTQRTTLDGRDYILRLNYNQREQHWYLDISDQSDSLIVAGLKVVCAFPLLRRLTDVRAPAGELFALDFSGNNADPGLGELGSRVQLVYFEAADLPGR